MLRYSKTSLVEKTGYTEKPEAKNGDTRLEQIVSASR